MILPQSYEGQDWVHSFEGFLSKTCPNWREQYQCVPAKVREIRKLEDYVRSELPGLPEEYMTFLRKMGGQGLFMNRRPILYPLDQTVLFQDEPVWLRIGSYDYYYESMFLAYCFPREGPSYLAIWDKGEEPLKVADSLGQLLCNLAFLEEGKEQFAFCCPMYLAFHLHEPPYSPCPEAEEYKRTHSTEGLTEWDLENIGFRIQLEKLEGPLKELGYERVWFSTELDHIWIKEDVCCILSKDFDPDDMFDTVAISLRGTSREEVWPLAERFKALGYGNYLELRDCST